MNANNEGGSSAKHPFYEETISTEKLFDGRMISLQIDTVRLPNGETATREIVKHPGAVAVIAILDGKLLVVEQFRKPLERAQVEIPAGKLDAGEAPDEAALRELEEETGYRARHIRHVRTFSTSPGFADELVHLYFADDLEAGEVRLDEEEFLTCEALTPEQADAYVREGRIFDAKTLLAVLIWRQWRETGAFGVSGLRPCFADMHVHIGSSADGRPVKISASRQLTFQAIAQEASERKGIALVGVIDCHAPAVQADIERLLDAGEISEVPGGGIRYRDTVILPGVEMEVRDEGWGGGPYHLLAYLPSLDAMKDWTGWIAPRMKNVGLSSQRIRATGRELQRELLDRGGLLVPAHIFTPHRGLLGCSADRVADRLDPEDVAAVELGLSADSAMAGRLSQLDRYTVLTNSDAHSTGMIGRECNELLIGDPSFAEFAAALRGEGGRRVTANLGLHPKLGKYHSSYCPSCKAPLADGAADDVCPSCGSPRLVTGVDARIRRLADRELPVWPEGRPPYRHQIPLSFFPGVGPKLRARLLREVGTEMDVLHRIDKDRIAAVAGERIADAIVDAREGRLRLTSGAGGTYGRIGTADGRP